ncbi:MAG TPA: hypothetical protein VK660_01390 [Xanthomonadaceae bacterium]|jgi:hypothetical protein|nr:hypothetical protein [Xanthomonadaceae bacterium]
MRTFVLFLALMVPPLVALGVAYGKSSTEIGKPVCTHFDDATKSAHHAVGGAATTTSASTPPVNSASAATTASTTTSTTASAGSAVAPQIKSGAATGSMRARGAPRWQTFLPGMFR